MKFFRRLASLFSSGKSDGKARTTIPNIDFPRLESIINYSIKNPQLFSEALSHRSYIQVPGNDALISYERLEFLGDSVLNLVIAEYLFEHHASAAEGDLTKIRSRLVNRKSLNVFARQIGLESFILVSPNAPRLGERGMEKILADAYEALIAAIFLDGGFDEASAFVRRQALAALKDKLVKIEDENFKSQLLEYSQAEGFGVPKYVAIKEEGPDHDRTFTIEVYLGNEPYGVGMGKNKKDAEQAAAEKALQRLQSVD